MYPDTLIHKLMMTVDPSDSSYTPSVIVTSLGESLQSLVEVKTTHVKDNEHIVKLLDNVQEVSGFLSQKKLNNDLYHLYLKFKDVSCKQNNVYHHCNG